MIAILLFILFHSINHSRTGRAFGFLHVTVTHTQSKVALMNQSPIGLTFMGHISKRKTTEIQETEEL